MLIIRSYSPEDVANIKKLCQRAFLGFPWFEVMTDEYIEKRWVSVVQNKKFCCLVAEIDNFIVGISWFYEITDVQLSLKGSDLERFVETKYSGLTKVWIDATIVDPNFQGRRIATTLKMKSLEFVRSNYSEVLLLTRMRDDNIGIIRINEKFGYSRTGVKVPAGKENLSHEFWYILV